MRIGIDGSNLRSGGSLTHIDELLDAARPERHGVRAVVVWGARALLDRLPRRPWLAPVHVPPLEGPLPARVAWQQTRLAGAARDARCDLLFVPGGTYLGTFRPFVTMSRNLLPFDLAEVGRYGASPMVPKLLLLRLGQSRTVRDADGTIFLHDHARARVARVVARPRGRATVIPHGVSARFRLPPRPQRPPDAYSAADPFTLLYVSAVEAYKHHRHVVEAVAALVRQGVPLRLELVGPARPAEARRLARVVRAVGGEAYVRRHGPLPYAELPAAYARADAFVFASSCENLPNALLEAMSAGLPIACSDRAPMPAILGDGGVYFDPGDPADIARAVARLVASPRARAECAATAYERAGAYTWERCADETFAFLRAVA